jgi:hypothetical protein
LRMDGATASRWARRVVLFFLPMAIVALYCLVLYLALDLDTFAIVGMLMVLYLFTPIGKYFLIPGALLVGVPHWMGSLRDLHGESLADAGLVAFSVAFVDAMTSLFLVYNFDILEAIPWLGKWVRRMEERGQERLRNGNGIALLGLAGFVSLSVQGSGGISSTILGRVAGMRDRSVVAAVWLGSLAGCSAIAVASHYVGGRIIDSGGRLYLEVAGFAILIVALAYFAYNAYRKGG